MRKEGGTLTAGANRTGLQPRAVAWGVLATVLVNLCLSGLLALIVYVGTIGEGAASGLLFYAGLLSLAVGAAYGARQAGTFGWGHGAAIGLAYVVLSLLAGSLLLPGGIGGGILGRLVLGLGVGAAGGILGMNL